jgi:predicted nucleic acid-binding protein
MSAERFTIGTNILVYSVDLAAGEKHEIAMEIIRRARYAPCWLTLQSISEFYTVVTRKRMVPRPEAGRLSSLLLDLFPAVVTSVAAVRSAMADSVSGRSSYWDALLIATAAEAGCTAILTEDLADGHAMHGVRVLNPFGDAALTPAAEALLTVH